jgi:release factor glutamine methyltransferase
LELAMRLMTSRNALRETITALTGHVPRPDVEAMIFLADLLGVEQSSILAHPEVELSSEQVAFLRQLVHERTQGAPLAYLRKQQEFFGRTFIVRPGVLIPRPATELLITAAIRGPKSIRTVVDVGTGSGCIACTVALERPDWQIIGIDPSPIAREVARENVARFHLDHRVQIHNGDLLKGVTALPDLIIANLPYLHPDQLQEATISAEPILALDGGPSGIDMIDELVRQIARYRRQPIGLLLECDPKDVHVVTNLVLEHLNPKQHRPLGEEAVQYGLEAWWY